MSKPQAGTLADILVVDDTPENLRLLSQTLSEKGYGVRTVTSGPRALESALASPPHLILLDIRMPDMDGFEVCSRLKEDERTRHIPIIFISALDQLKEKVQAFQTGGVDYITKPFQVDEVLARTETHLALRRLQARLEEINTRLQQELMLAGKVQTSFLPSEMPRLTGWQFAASLKPARETSGDFYDFIQLPNEHLGLLIADVVDKGVPAALLMAMSMSLIRSHAAQDPDTPGEVFAKVNQSLLDHLGGNQFLTSFYGLLDPKSGRFIYVNAGQPPPLLLKAGDVQTQKLALTGPPLGIIEDSRWESVEVTLQPGDTLVLYTDGVTDAQEHSGGFYGAERLHRVAESHVGESAQAIHDAILTDIDSFVADTPQFDDTALIVVSRQNETSATT
jgi:sigma-B regulation protein RsbU (phosphoserine phosphatase)